MFREQFNRGAEGFHSDAFVMNESEILVPKFKGIVKDRMFDVLTGELLEEREWDHNIVVANASTLIACLMAGASGYAGATWWAVGSGSTAWDTTPVNPASTDSALVAEVFRKQIPAGSITFTDANGNALSSGQISNNIQIQLTFASADANFALREFAIYGGNASATAGSGLMINHKIHPVINKTSAISLQRTLRFTF